jgi:broad specificity phosphatase PhoE
LPAVYSDAFAQGDGYGVMTDLYFIRHGQASFGTKNYDRLSALGVRQARLLADYLLDMEAYFPIVYSGTQKRQMETAQIIESCLKKNEVGVSHRILPELDEFDAMKFLTHCKDDMVRDDPRFKEELNRCFSDYQCFQKVFVKILEQSLLEKFHSVPTENFQSFKDRVSRGIQTVINENKPYKKVAVVTSGGVLALVMQLALRLSDAETVEMVWHFYNSSISVFCADNNCLELKLDNCVAHLGLFNDPQLLTYV